MFHHYIIAEKFASGSPLKRRDNPLLYCLQ